MGDKRSYIVKLKKKTEVTIDDLQKYSKTNKVELGKMKIVWISEFGEKNIYSTDPMAYDFKSDGAKAFIIKLKDPPTKLVIEEPLMVSMMVTNMSNPLSNS